MEGESDSSDTFDPVLDYSEAIKQLQGGHKPISLSLTSDELMSP